jgi:predicted O-linked N-acetylglucosamine transferase (SPINDLY family)
MVAAGRIDEAEGMLRAFLARSPGDANALNFLGLICHRRGEHAEAVRLIAGAVENAPDVGFFHANLGEALRAAGLLPQAEAQARESVRCVPDSSDFAYNLANILFQRHAYAEALTRAEQVLAAKPDWVEALHLAAKLDFELGHLATALSRYERGLSLRPGDPEMSLALERTRLWACQWRHDLVGLSRVLARWVAQPMAPEFGGLNPFVAYQFDLPPALHKAVADAHASRFVAGIGPSRPHFDFASHKVGCDAGRRLRIGYVSADFHGHPTMHLMRGLFRLHDRTRFEVTAYSIGADDGSAYRRAIVNEAEHFCDIRDESARDTARRIFADGIDILVDLKGFTLEARPEIFALRPAPLNVAWLGYPGTTGTGLNDYAIVDHVVTPSGHDNQFGEQLVRMPHSYQINDNSQVIAGGAPSRRELGLPEGGFVFACFNHVYKIDSTMFACWMRILARVPHSVMWLYQSNAEARANLEAAASGHGVDPGRLVFAGTLPKPEHLARLARADLFLDTRLVNAHTGASDALWAGLPLITCPQQGFPSRVGASLLCAAGLPQLVCASLSEYEALAVRLSGAPDELLALRRHLCTAHETLPLFDTPRFVRNLERAYESMWQHYLTGRPPLAFDVKEQP